MQTIEKNVNYAKNVTFHKTFIMQNMKSMQNNENLQDFAKKMQTMQLACFSPLAHAHAHTHKHTRTHTHTNKPTFKSDGLTQKGRKL